MVKRKFVGYFRVSTQRQGQSGLGLEAQQETVRAFLSNDGELVNDFIEVESGRNNNRPELAKALSYCQLVGAVLVVAKLDRLARDTEFLKRVMRESGDGGVVFCDMPNIPAGPQGKFLIGIMAEVAELEAGMISARTRDALAAVKRDLAEKGQRTSKAGRVYTRLGAPSWENLAEVASRGRVTSLKVRQQNRQRHAVRVRPVIEAMQQQGKTLREIAAALNDIGSTAPRGGVWQANTVSRVLQLQEV